MNAKLHSLTAIAKSRLLNVGSLISKHSRKKRYQLFAASISTITLHACPSPGSHNPPSILTWFDMPSSGAKPVKLLCGCLWSAGHSRWGNRSRNLSKTCRSSAYQTSSLQRSPRLFVSLPGVVVTYLSTIVRASSDLVGSVTSTGH